ncbi:hypothetical protein D3C72_1912410 [compost metagenome]
MGGVVGAVGDGAGCGEGDAVVVAHLGDGGAFHFYGQHVVAGVVQCGAQAHTLIGVGDKAVAAGNQAVVGTVQWRFRSALRRGFQAKLATSA